MHAGKRSVTANISRCTAEKGAWVVTHDRVRTHTCTHTHRFVSLLCGRKKPKNKTRTKQTT